MYIERSIQTHIDHGVPEHFVAIYYESFFALFRKWNSSFLQNNHKLETNITKIEQFVSNNLLQSNKSQYSSSLKNGTSSLHELIATIQNSQKSKLSAIDFYAEGTMDRVDIDELIEACHELKEACDEIEQRGSECLALTNTCLKTYAKTLQKKSEFRELGLALHQLYGIIEFNLSSIPHHPRAKKFFVYLHAIVEDLLQWTQHVLISFEAIDIHYLDASMISNILQCEIVLGDSIQSSYDEEDLELF